MLHVKDFIRAHHAGDLRTLRRIVRPLARVAATTSAAELLALFKKQRVHAALVVDEYGGTMGFVAMDDIVEDLIDEEESASSEWIRRLPDGTLVMNGEVTLAELSQDHGIVFAKPDGTLPQSGAIVRRDGRQMQIEEMEGQKITRVRLSND